MLRTLARGLLSASLIGLVGGGGGGLPALDVLLYHRSFGAAEAARPHYEATSGCHADRCAIFSTASQSRSVLGVPVAGVSAAPSGEAAPLPTRAALHASVPPPHYFSRAPPPVS
jgi:hypothetical protein